MTKEQFLENLGKKIRDQRKAKGITALDIYAEINMETSNYSAIENGRQNATAFTLKKIADAIKVEVSTFF